MDSLSKSTEKQSRFELRTLLETSRMLIESRETDFILNNLLLITMGKMLVPRGAVLLYQRKDNYLVTKVKGKSRVREGDLVQLPWRHDKYEEVVVDPLKMDQPPPELFEGKNRGLFFNLKSNNHHLGYLYLGRKGDDRVLNAREIEFVESLSIISSVAISNSKLFSEMRDINRMLDRRIHELNTLFDLSKDFNIMVDREKIASTLKFALLGQLMVRNFFLLYKIDGEIDLMATNGLHRSPNLKERKKIFRMAEDVLPLDENHNNEVGYLKENGITVLVALQMQGEKIAVVGVGHKANKEELTEPDFNFLQSLGNLAVLSIQRTLFLEEHIEKERLDEELLIAKTIQKGLFPDSIPDIPTLDLAVKNIPSEQVGGDYYDIVETPDQNYIFAIGDVTGKGIPAAMLMANLQSMLHILLPVKISLSDATSRINNLLCENTPSDKFITFFWGKYYHERRTFSYINAGHNPPLLLRRSSDTFTKLKEGGLILGAFPSAIPYEETTIDLQPDDLLVFYTDGITEAFSRDGTEYDEERLESVILANRDLPAEELLEKIVDDINIFTGGNLSDDMTLIVLKGTE